MSVLTREKVLVLNRGWTPIGIIGVKRAMKLVTDSYKDGQPKARIMDPQTDFRLWEWKDWAKLVPSDEHKVIRSANGTYRLPSIILVSRYNKLPYAKGVHFSRRTIYRRDNNTCQYCGKKPGLNSLSIDHILPKSKGGLTTWTNCCLACTECNRKKGDKTMAEAAMKFFDSNYKPFKPKFSLFKDTVYVCEDWQSILGEVYWSVELQNDM